MRELVNKVGTLEQDNLIAKMYPPAEVTGVTIKAVEEATVYKRGTVMAQSSEDGKLVILGSDVVGDETLNAAYILCDDVVVDDSDVKTVAYRSGCFSTDALKVKEDYSLTQKDRDDLRKYGIVLHDNMQ